MFLNPLIGSQRNFRNEILKQIVVHSPTLSKLICLLNVCVSQFVHVDNKLADCKKLYR